jgi:phosphoribosylanthranilate isomerase
MRTRIKMCGTTRLEDGLAAVRYGVDALGFILYPNSPRYISPEDIAVICGQLPPFVDRVGVLVDEDVETAVRLVNRAGFSYLQLHGSESSHYCRELKNVLPHLKLIKAFRVGEQTQKEEFTPYAEHADAFLLDTFVRGDRGGTGQVFDWSLVAGLNLNRPVILAGGLSPENITSAISALRPYGVDINSGVEDGPGKKNHARLKDMIERIIRCHENSAEEVTLR